MPATPALHQRLAHAMTRPAARPAWRVLLALLVLAVCYLALSPKPPPGVSLGWDKLNHATAFVAMAVAAWLGATGPWRRRVLWLLALLAFGGLIEILQMQVPGRSAEWADLLADGVGIAVGAALAAAVARAAPWPPAN